MNVKPTLRSWIALLALPLAAACADPEPAAPDRTESTWTTEVEYQFGDAFEGDAIFHFIRSVRVDREGERVFTVETALSRVSVWTPDGKRLVEVGRPGEGPGDFAWADDVFLDDSGFVVRDLDRNRFTRFSDDGALQTTAKFPGNVSYQGFRLEVVSWFPDGSFLAKPRLALSVLVGARGDDPIHSVPLLRVFASGDGWSHRPLWRLNIRNEHLWFKLSNGGHSFSAQPFSDADRYEVDLSAGTVVLARNAGENLGAGEAELLELTAAGDTVWQRWLRFDPIPLAGSVLDEQVDRFLAVLQKRAPGARSPRNMVDEALYAPEHLPAVKWGLFLTSFSGHVWIESHERVDTMRVWYSVRRGDNETPPRRVLLPESFRAHDATETHVWGVWSDELGVNHVEGRRLVDSGHSER